MAEFQLCTNFVGKTPANMATKARKPNNKDEPTTMMSDGPR